MRSTDQACATRTHLNMHVQHGSGMRMSQRLGMCSTDQACAARIRHAHVSICIRNMHPRHMHAQTRPSPLQSLQSLESLQSLQSCFPCSPCSPCSPCCPCSPAVLAVLAVLLSLQSCRLCVPTPLQLACPSCPCSPAARAVLAVHAVCWHTCLGIWRFTSLAGLPCQEVPRCFL